MSEYKASRKELSERSKDLRKGFMVVKDRVMITLMAFLILIIPGIVYRLVRGFPDDFLFEIDKLQWFGIIFNGAIIAAAPAFFFCMGHFSPWVERSWQRNYRQAWSWLSHTSVGQLSADDELYEKLEKVRSSGNLRYKACGVKPGTLEEKLNLACENRGLLMAMARVEKDPGNPQRERAFKAMHRWCGFKGSLEGFANSVFHVAQPKMESARRGCAWLIITLPLWIPLLGLYTRRLAWETALIDFLRDKPAIPVNDVDPPPGLG